ncbi:hypothetical protein TNCV_3192901 [Trichonephila clavipes]|nr:hypothetical protein TNCV_3192901 [Trichonephila clavipes]
MKKQKSGSNKTEPWLTLHSIHWESFLLDWTSLFESRHCLVPKGSHLIYHPVIFFLWRHLKAQVYKHRPTTTKEDNHPGSGCHSTGNDTKNYGWTRKYKLRSTTYGKKGNKQVVVRHKWGITDLLNIIVEAGGSTDYYELVDKSSCQTSQY